MFGKKNTVVIGDRLRARPPMPAYAPRPSYAERPTRDAVFHNAVVVLTTGERFRIAVKDLSADGARIEFFHDIPFTECVLLIDVQTAMKRHARIVWHRQGVAGLAFIDTLG